MMSRVKIALGVLALSGLGCGAGCDQQTPAGRAIQRASAGIHTPSPEGARRAGGVTYTDVVREVQGAGDQGLAGETAAARTLLARAQSGLSGPAVLVALESEREASRRGTLVRAAAGEYVGRSAQAAALATYDPGPLIAELERSAAERGREAEARAAEAARLRSEDEALRARMNRLLEQAKGRSDEAGRLMQEAGRLSATEATPVVARAAEAKRAGDRLAVEAALLEARADQVTPRVRQAELEVERLRALRRDLEASIADLRARAATAAEQVARARAAAASAAGDVARLTDELREYRAGTLTRAWEEALRLLQQAVQSASRAGNEAGVAGRLAVGTAQQALADACLIRAQGLRDYADLLDDLARAQPTLPDAPAYEADARTAREAARGMLDQAASAYRSAQSAYAGVQTRAEVKESLARLAESLEHLAKVAQGESLDLLGQYLLPRSRVGRGEPPRGEAPRNPPRGGADPSLVEAINAAYAAQRAGDYDAVLADVIADDAAKRVLRQQFEVGAKVMRVDAAVKARFGKGLFESAGPQLAAMGMDPRALSGDLSAADLDITMTGPDSARAAVRGAAPMMPPMTYRRVEGRWKLDLTDLAPMVQMMAPMMSGMSRALDGLIADVEGGKFASPEAVLMGLQQRMMESMGGGG